MIERLESAVGRLVHDTAGASLVEFTIIMPVFFALAFGAVDLGFLLYKVNSAAKATHVGARAAIVNDSVASGLTDLTAQYWSQESYGYYENIGQPCQNSAGGLITTNCPQIQVTCDATAAGGSCSSAAHAFNNVAFTPIFEAMQKAFPELSRQYVRVTYKTTGLGFAGRPDLPMEVSVSIRCMPQQLYFSGMWNIFAPPKPQECTGGPAGWYVPKSTSAFTAEDFKTADAVPAAAQ